MSLVFQSQHHAVLMTFTHNASICQLASNMDILSESFLCDPRMILIVQGKVCKEENQNSLWTKD